MNVDAIWSKILTLKVYGSYEQQLGRKTSPALLTAHVLYFHFLCYPPPSSPRVPLQRCVSCSWDLGTNSCRGPEVNGLTQIDAHEGTPALSEPTWW